MSDSPKRLTLHPGGSPMDGFWLFIAIVVVARSPIGRAIADRIAGRTAAGGGIDHRELEAIEHRMEDRIIDLEERLEFAERMLQKQRSQNGLPPL